MTNRSRLFLGEIAVDMRSGLARRFQDQVEAFASQIDGDLDPGQEALVRNAACLSVLLELDQARVAAGEDLDDERYLRRVESLRKVLNALGLQRTARAAGPKSKAAQMTDPHAAAVMGAMNDER